jgi:molybdopterin molybdotransferase
LIPGLWRFLQFLFGTFMKTTNAADALRMILECVREKGTEKVRLEKALGRVLAENILAPTNLPPFDNSAMDGFAIADPDRVDGERIMRIVGESRAGRVFGRRLEAGEAVQVMTGGKMPEGADTVVPLEDVRIVDDGHIGVASAVSRGSHIRYAGEDVREGETILTAGELILESWHLSGTRTCGCTGAPA